MKKNVFFATFLVLCIRLYAEPIYKSFNISGIIENKWVNPYSETIYEYDDSNNLVHELCTGALEYEVWYNYDKLSNLISKKYQRKDSYWYEEVYDSYHNPISYKTSNGYEIEYSNEYDELGNLIYIKYSNNTEIWNEYDKHNNIINTFSTDYNKTFTGYVYKYDNANLTYYIDSEGEHWLEYDNDNHLLSKLTNTKFINETLFYNKKGDVIYNRSTGFTGYGEFWYEYDYSNGRKTKCIAYKHLE